MHQKKSNIDAAEIAKFDALSNEWWDLQGPMKALHQINPLRLQYIQNQMDLSAKEVIDIGCGGGILTESLARCGAEVTGIDLAESLILLADDHAHQTGLTINYQTISTEAMVQKSPDYFDVVTCMELLEHVSNPEKIVQDCTKLVKPGGLVFFATINRNLSSFLGAIIGAEYILRLLPRGTHQYAQFIKPSELTLWAARAQLTLKGMTGINYQPLSGKFHLSKDISINYIVCFQRATQ